MTIIVLSSEEIAAYKKVFDQCFDRDKDGTMTTQELGNILRNLGQNPTEAELQELVIQLDKDKNGTVEFEELLAIINGNLMESVDEMTELKEIFNIIDKDKNGLIGYSDLKSIIAASGLNISEEDAERMIDEADRDHDKQISFEDFSDILKPANVTNTGHIGATGTENLSELASLAAESLGARPHPQ